MSRKTGLNKNIISVEEREQQVLEGVPVGHRENFKQLIQEYHDLFMAQLPKGIPPSREVQHHIDVEPGSKPPYRPPYRLGPTEQDVLWSDSLNCKTAGAVARLILDLAPKNTNNEG